MQRTFLPLFFGLAVAACGARTGMSVGGDASLDAVSPGDVAASVTNVTLGQNCMPAVLPDPTSVQGQVAVANHTSATIGPVHVASGQIVDGSDTVVATFAVNDDFGSIGPGDSVVASFSKASGTLAPAKGCSIGCGKDLRVALIFSGPGVPDGLRAVSPITKMGCYF
jgi:hypothetical protein